MLQQIGEFEELESLREEWDGLCERTKSSPLLSHAWIACAAQAFVPPGCMRVLCVRDEAGELAAVAPLSISNTPQGKALTLIGAPQLGEPIGFLFRDGSALMELSRHVVRLGLPVQLARLMADAPERAALVRALRIRGVAASIPEAGSPYLAIVRPWNEFERTLPSRRHQRLRRAQRLAAGYGPVSFSIDTPAEAGWESCFQEFIRVEQASWKGIEGTALGQDRHAARFYQMVGSRFAGRGELIVAKMLIGGEAAAMQLCLKHHGAIWVLKIGFDQRYAHCSPGVLLMHEMIRYAHEQGCARFEFLGLQEPWLSIWTDTFTSYVTLRVLRYNFRGLYELSVLAARKALRSGRRYLAADGAPEAYAG